MRRVSVAAHLLRKRIALEAGHGGGLFCPDRRNRPAGVPHSGQRSPGRLPEQGPVPHSNRQRRQTESGILRHTQPSSGGTDPLQTSAAGVRGDFGMGAGLWGRPRLDRLRRSHRQKGCCGTSTCGWGLPPGKSWSARWWRERGICPRSRSLPILWRKPFPASPAIVLNHNPQNTNVILGLRKPAGSGGRTPSTTSSAGCE